MKTFDDAIANLKQITLMEKDDIIFFVEQNNISYEDFRRFYLRFAKTPTPKECAYLNAGLFELLKLNPRIGI